MELRKFRKNQKMSCREFAKKLGISRQWLNNLETEKYKPSLKLMIRISTAFKVKLAEVLKMFNVKGE